VCTIEREIFSLSTLKFSGLGKKVQRKQKKVEFKFKDVARCEQALKKLREYVYSE